MRGRNFPSSAFPAEWSGMDPDLPRLPESGATSGAAVHLMVGFV
ncbi:hypothetical protein RBSH_00127 [Rhodopirellula baltica SH28]|uniref:Uncharacterized protein n=1 Tax=Rhodopirellula baltica SH28 TaxID=993517 RepID=K5DCQ3_RHOBT|nr:hypothetical protein RBSH_00127 [Rhodopirellula baltica SH28]